MGVPVGSSRWSRLVGVGLVVVAFAGVVQAAPGAAATPFQATGFFHTASADGRMWLVDPGGRPFYSSGIDHVSAAPDTDRHTGTCPYCQAVAARYPSANAWADGQIRRLRRWGFNTLGSFSDDDAHLRRNMPYTVLLSMADGPDWFATAFADHADAVARPLAANRDDPNLLGYFTDSELHWGPDWRGRTPLLEAYLALPAGAPGRAVAEAHKGDPSGFLFALAHRYFSVSTAAIRRYDPHHLILGAKTVAQLTEPALLKAARPYVDVWSVDDYAILPVWQAAIVSGWKPYLPDRPGLADIEAVIGKPILIGEYGFRAADSGLPNTWPPLFPTFATQAERTAQYTWYLAGLYASPAVVGDHFFEYVDEPPHGRFDGEDSNWGVLSVGDVPYTALLHRMTQVHAFAPGRVTADPPCLSWAPGPTPGAPRCVAR